MKTAYVLVNWTAGTAYVVLGVYSSSERAERAQMDEASLNPRRETEILEFEVDE